MLSVVQLALALSVTAEKHKKASNDFYRIMRNGEVFLGKYETTVDNVIAEKELTPDQETEAFAEQRVIGTV
jgi:hypothetical protein